MINPTLDPNKLSTEEKIKLVQESDGLLIELLEGLSVGGSLYLNVGILQTDNFLSKIDECFTWPEVEKTNSFRT